MDCKVECLDEQFLIIFKNLRIIYHPYNNLRLKVYIIKYLIINLLVIQFQLIAKSFNLAIMVNSLLHSAILDVINSFQLDHSTLAEIKKIFQIPPDSHFDAKSLSKSLLKNELKIFEFLQSESANYKNSFSSLIFNNLKPASQEKIHMLSKSIWTEYVKRCALQKKILQIQQTQRFLPKFTTLDQVQAFHLQLYNLFITSSLCQRNASIESIHSKEFNFIDRQNSNEEGLEYQRQVFDKQVPAENNEQNGIFAKIQEDFQNKEFMQSEQNLISNQGYFLDPGNMNKNFEQQQSPNYLGLPGKKRSEDLCLFQQIKSRDSNGFEIGSLNQPYHNTAERAASIAENDQQLSAKMQQLMFIQCACQGLALKQSAPFMICGQCHFYYHYQCLLIEEQTDLQICPCCKLKDGSNFFIKIHQQAYGKRWCKNFKTQSLSLSLTQRELEQIRQSRLNIKKDSEVEYQLRFLKLRRIKNKKVGEQGSIHRKFNNLPLPFSYIEKMQPVNQFQISLNCHEEDNRSELSYFFAIFIVEKYCLQTLAEGLLDNAAIGRTTGGESIQNFLKQDQEYLTISLEDPISRTRIQHPARGKNCAHAEVFDYISLLAYYKKQNPRFKVIVCPICQNEIQNFIPDKFLSQKLPQIHHDKKSLRYYKDGRIETVNEQTNYSQRNHHHLEN